MGRYGLPEAAAPQVLALLSALAREDDPHTTVSEPAAALDRHIADGLSGLRVPGVSDAQRIADIGAGAGFPGLALAIALPDARIDLVESARRKTAVISRLIAAADLANARAITARVEDWAAGDGAAAYDLVTVRAVASLPVLVEYAAPLLADEGRLVAWKGAPDPDEEAAGAKAAEIVGLTRSDVVTVRPFRGSKDRQLHLYVKTSRTPERFPRRPGMARKRPIA